MNIQTEHLEDHTARLTVEVDADRFERAKRQAARQIANQIRIPGFRKGKVPYNILVQRGFEQQIIMDAVENLSQDVYRESLDQSELLPYGPGAFEDFEIEPAVKFIYTLPLQPTVDLGDYQAVRLDYEAPEVTDEEVDAAMKRLQEQEALVEEKQGPVALGNRLTVDIHSEFLDDGDGEDADDEADDETESEAEDVIDDVESDEDDRDENVLELEDDEDNATPLAGDVFMHEHDAVITLSEDNEPLPGFNDHLVGANVDDELEFELTVPEDSEDFTDIVGRRIRFHISVKGVAAVTLPELNDDLAARITQDEDEPLTLLQLRVRMRETLQQEKENQAKRTYAGRVLDEIVQGATLSYPEVMVSQQTDTILRDLESRLRQQGMGLKEYYSVTGKTEEELREDYRETAVTTLERSLVLGEVASDLQLRVTERQVEAQLDKVLERFGEQGAQLRAIFDTPNMRENIVNELMMDGVNNALFAIGRGEPLPEPEPEPEAEVEVEADDVEETVAEADTETVAEAVAEADTAADAEAVAEVDEVEVADEPEQVAYDEVGDDAAEEADETDEEANKPADS